MNFGGNPSKRIAGSVDSNSNGPQWKEDLEISDETYEPISEENCDGGFCFGTGEGNDNENNENIENDKDTIVFKTEDKLKEYKENVFYEDIAHEADDMSDERDDDANYKNYYSGMYKDFKLDHDTFRPGIDVIPDGYEMEPDMTTYDMLHEFSTQWPLLSIDTVCDFFTYDKNPYYRTAFPHSIVFIGGEQTNEGTDNLIVGKINNLCMNKAKTVNEEAEEEDIEATFPRLETRAISIGAPINRVRTCANGYFKVAETEESEFCGTIAGNPALAACFTADKTLTFIDLGHVFNDLELPGANSETGNDNSDSSASKNAYVSKSALKSAYTNNWKDAFNKLSQQKKKATRTNPSYSYPGAKSFFGDFCADPIILPSEQYTTSSGILASFTDFGCEGYGLAFDPLKYICISGDCEGKLRMYHINQSGAVVPSDFLRNLHKDSIEDIVFAKSGTSLAGGFFATCSADRSIAIVDPKLSGNESVLKIENAHDADVNVIDWNYFDDHFLLSGGDDGAIKVWDIRSTNNGPYSSFGLHKGQVTSVAWSPDYKDPLSFASCGEDNLCYFWDLDCNGDEEIPDDQINDNFLNQRLMRPNDLSNSNTKNFVNSLPKELMFVHMGLQEPKEVRYSQQIPGAVIITHNKGIQVVKPFNSGPSYELNTPDSEHEEQNE